MTDGLGPHDMASVHLFIHMSLRALFEPTNQLPHCVHERCVCGPFGSTLSSVDPSAPPVSQEILGLCHGAHSRFQLGMSLDPVNNRFAVALDLQGPPLPSHRCMKFKRRQVPWLLCRPGPVVYVFLLHSLFHGFEQGRL